LLERDGERRVRLLADLVHRDARGEARERELPAAGRMFLVPRQIEP
jgi:hypothetical protein